MVAVLLVTGFILPAFAQNQIAEAEELFRAGQFANALNVYEAELKNNPNDPYIYYNIGNCYFKMGSIGLAVANYYRAFKLDPRDGDIRHNLDLALRAGGSRLVPSGLPASIHQAFFYFSADELKGLDYVLFWLFSVVFCIWLFFRKGKRAVIVCAVLWMLCQGWVWWRASIDNEALAVVAAPMAELRSGPGKTFPTSATVAQGHLVIVEDEKDNWYEIIIKEQGLKGWVAKDAIKNI